jgi:hypothetical protein
VSENFFAFLATATLFFASQVDGDVAIVMVWGGAPNKGLDFCADLDCE